MEGEHIDGPDAEQVIGPEGGGDNWRDVYLSGSELYQEPTLATIKDVPALAKLAVEARKTLGRYSTEKGLLRPKDGAPPEEWEQFHLAMGRPEKPEGYEIAKPDNLPEGFPYAPELAEYFRQWAFEIGLSANAAKSLFDKYMAVNLKYFEERQKAHQAETAALQAELQKEWGDQYPENLAMAREAMRQFFPKGSKALAALDRVMGDDADLLRMAHAIGKGMTEAGLIKGSATLTASLEAKKQELSAHPAFLDNTHAEHQQVVHQFNEVLKQIVAEEEARESKQG